jgi:Pro-kumamolisin, activation domain/Bacterial Ig-like domain (group 3)
MKKENHMQRYKQLRPSSMTKLLSSLMILGLFASISGSASAQAASATDHAPAAVNLSNTPLDQSRTPQEVTNGTANLLGRYDADAKLRLVLGLNPPKLAEEEKFLRQLQDKKSPNYHQYLTAEKWNARFAPAAADEQAVVDWASSNGLTVTKRFPNRLIVDVEGTTAAIEKAFGVQINNYQVGENTEFSNDRDPAIPAKLVNILHSVGGLNSIQRVHAPHEGNIRQVSSDYSPEPLSTTGTPMHADGDKAAYIKAMKASEAKAAARGNRGAFKGQEGGNPDVTNGYIDPTDIYSSYGYDFNALQNQGHCCNPLGNSGMTPPITSIGIATSGDFADTDVQGFQHQYPYLAYHYNRRYIDGTATCCNDETTLDVEWAIATSNDFGAYQNTSYVWVYEAVNNQLSTFTDVYNQMLSDGNARIFSTSWGCGEFACTAGSTMDTDHAIFNSMLGQGWTIMALSHDHGATGSCDDADRTSYPGSDPDATSVGGTSLQLFSNGTFYAEGAWQGGTSAKSCVNNNGGSGGGCSAKFAAPSYQSSPFCGSTSRSVPDIALNAGYGQNYYFEGKLGGVGGTSIATPMVAGFMAQENAYLLFMGSICGVGSGTAPCAPMGQVDYPIYYEGYHSGYAPHYPFYDILTGCNNNDITALYSLGYYCAGTGYDAITGWGSFNALQMAWMINWSTAADEGNPYFLFSGPTTGKWYNSDQIIAWDVFDSGGNYPATGVSGFSQQWDVDPGDVGSEPTQGTGNSFYSGPQYPTEIFGCTDITGQSCSGGGLSQGCHTLHLRAWDNMGAGTGNTTYGPVCYDTVAPHTTAQLSGTLSGSTYTSAVTVTLSSSDASPGSGVASTNDQINGGTVLTYATPFSVATAGVNKVIFYSTDVAGNVESSESTSFSITSGTTTGLTASANPSPSGKAVKFTAVVSPTLAGVPTGKVTFMDGATVLATKSLSNGAATLSTSALTGGSHSISATYAGATYFTGSTASLTEVIANTTTTTLASSANPSQFGQSVTFTATIGHSGSASPTGTVQFLNGTAVLGTAPVSGGTAALSTSTLTVAASHSIKAVYSGDANFSGSTSGVFKQQVVKAGSSTSLTSSSNPSNSGKSVTFTATVTPSTSGTATGNVAFMDGATKLGSHALSGGVAAFSTSKLAAGTHNITAVYAGNPDFTTSTSPILQQVVNP